MKDVGLRLKHARKLRGMTQARLAQLSGVKQGSISDLERGESKSFRGVTLVSIARVLNVRAEWLSQGKGPMERRDIPLSEEAIAVAQHWDRLHPDVRVKIADMIFALPQETSQSITDDSLEPIGSGPGRPGKRRP